MANKIEQRRLCEAFYYVYVPNDHNAYEKLTIIPKSELADWLQTEALKYERIKLVKNTGNFVELLPLGESDWDVVNRGIEPLAIHEKRTFKDFSKKREFDKKVDRANKDKPMDKRRHYMKAARGINRKRQNYVPLYKQMAHQENLPTAQNVLDNAKKASSGTWKLSNRQVQELSGKYKFNIPTDKKRTKHLGSTGILMWRKNQKEFYLVKFDKHRK